MAITQNFNVNPYYDDFNEDKNYQRILFRPGYAVQARELTQLQTILQKQIERFGKHIFKEGSMVLGGQTLYENENVFFVKINDEDSNANIVNVNDFVGKFIKKVGSNSVRAYVMAAATSTETDPKTLIVKYFSNERFTINDVIEDENGNIFAQVVSSNPTGNSSIVSIDEGVFFVDGFFVKVNRQTIILDKYNVVSSYRVGLQIEELLVDENNDTSLLDPALEASNYQAPGANRFQINLILSKRTLTSPDDSKFIELLRIQDGIVRQRITYPQYSVIEDTLARRTFDESGNYTVRPFTVSFRDDIVSNNGVGFANSYNIILSPGKAYVKGYEFETISPTIIVSPRARDFDSETSYNLTVNYKNYVDVTNLVGNIDFQQLTPLDIHCVPSQSINTSSSSTISSTKIGTTRIRSVDYQFGASASSGIANAVFRTYIFDTNIANKTANATGGSANTIVLDDDASDINDAYVGVKLRIESRSGNTAQSEIKVIQSYDGSTKTASFDTNWIYNNPDSDTVFSLDYEFKDSESFIISNSSNVIVTSMNISDDSKFSILTDDYAGAFVSETNFNSLLISFPNFAIKENSLTNSEYNGKKLYTGTFSSDVFSFTTNSIVPGLTPLLTGTLSASDALNNFLVIAGNSVVNLANTTENQISIAGNLVTITANGVGDVSANVYMKVDIDDASVLQKTKQRLSANTTIVSTIGGQDIVSGNVTLFLPSVDPEGSSTDQSGLQLTISKEYNENLKDSSLTQSLYVADVISIAAVYDFGDNPIDTANLSSAIDITSNYELITGQTDNAYNHSKIRLISGTEGPKGNVVIFADYLYHSGFGYFSVDSYINGGIEYKDIPTYTSPVTGRTIYLRDVIDFRPRLRSGNSGISGLYSETILPITGTPFETDFSYYLPRIDKIAVTKDRKFEIIQGISSLTPVPPRDKEDSMTIYILVLPAYVGNVESIRARFIENRRYTMRDIGSIEQRVQNLEYYSTLNFLEKVAADEQFLDDSTGLPRVKTGIVVDPFTGYKVADVTSEDYNAAVDIDKGIVRPTFETQQFRFEIGSSSINYDAETNIVSPAYEIVPFISQPLSSQSISINPFNAEIPAGTTQIEAVDSEYADETQPPEVIDNIEGVNDVWAACIAKYVREKNLRKLSKLRERQLLRRLFSCYKREWRWWERRIKRKKIDISKLPVPTQEQIDSFTNAIQNVYGTNKSLDKNIDTFLSQGGLDGISNNWDTNLTKILKK
jgi:hypothetical protein